MNSKKIFMQRPVDPSIYKDAQGLGLTALQAKIVAGRAGGYSGELAHVVSPSLKHLSHPQLLKDCGKAATRIADAVISNRPIAIVTDYDVDGVCAHALLVEALQKFYFPIDSILSYIGHRLTDGYGLSTNIIDRLLSSDIRPEVVITADCGSSDHERIQLLGNAGIDVIVTDHHAIPIEGIPGAAYAVVNPAREDCLYPDGAISGCMVSWLVMCQVRNELIERNYLPEDTPRLGSLLDYVALSTVADAVSLLSPTNRAVVMSGLDKINTLNKPAWMSLAKLCNKTGYSNSQFTAEDLGFLIGPRINAQGRVDDPIKALQFLLSESGTSADNYLEILDKNNMIRKVIEKEMVSAAKLKANELVRQGKKGLVIFEEDFHPGVQGIVASRLVDNYGLPTVVFSRVKEASELAGSARTISEIHIREALQKIDSAYPGLILTFGGHKGAAGLKIAADQLAVFAKAFEDVVSENESSIHLKPKVYTDGELGESALSISTIKEMKAVEPFGRGFAEPVFEGIFTIGEIRLLGKEPVHVGMKLSSGNESHNAIWFRALDNPGDMFCFNTRDTIRCAYKLKKNNYRGKQGVQLIIEHAQYADDIV